MFQIIYSQLGQIIKGWLLKCELPVPIRFSGIGEMKEVGQPQLVCIFIGYKADRFVDIKLISMEITKS